MVISLNTLLSRLSKSNYHKNNTHYRRWTGIIILLLSVPLCVCIYVYTCCVSWFEVISLSILLSRLSKSNIQNHNNKYKGERSMTHYIIIIIISIIEMSCNNPATCTSFELNSDLSYFMLHPTTKMQCRNKICSLFVQKHQRLKFPNKNNDEPQGV